MGVGQLQMQNFNFAGNNPKKGIHEDYIRQMAARQANVGQAINMGIQFEQMNFGGSGDKRMAVPAVPALTNQGQVANYSHHF